MSSSNSKQVVYKCRNIEISATQTPELFKIVRSEQHYQWIYRCIWPLTGLLGLLWKMAVALFS